MVGDYLHHVQGANNADRIVEFFDTARINSDHIVEVILVQVEICTFADKTRKITLQPHTHYMVCDSQINLGLKYGGR